MFSRGEEGIHCYHYSAAWSDYDAGVSLGPVDRKHPSIQFHLTEIFAGERPSSGVLKDVTDGSAVLRMGQSSHGISSNMDIVSYVAPMVRELGNHKSAPRKFCSEQIQILSLEALNLP